MCGQPRHMRRSCSAAAALRGGSGGRFGHWFAVAPGMRRAVWLVIAISCACDGPVERDEVTALRDSRAFDHSVRVDTPRVCGLPRCGPAAAPPPTAALRGVWVGPTTVWVVGDEGAIGRRARRGGSWCWCAWEPAVSWRDVWGAGDDDVWIVGGDGDVLHFKGAGFAVVDVGATAELTGVWGSAADDVFIVGDAGTVRRLGATSWSSPDLPPDRALGSVWGTSGGDVWIGGSEPAPYPGDPAFDGYSSVIYRWQPATGSWALEATYTMYYGVADFRGIHGTGPDDVWAVGMFHPAGAAAAQSRAVRYDGAAWSVVPVPDLLVDGHSYADVAVAAPGAEAGVWIVGGINALRYDGGAWTAGAPLTAGLLALDHRDDDMWAVGTSGKILRWNGADWVPDW